MELDTLTVTGIIIADLLITFGLLILVYYFSKDKKGRPSAGAGSRPRGKSYFGYFCPLSRPLSAK